MKYDFCTDSNSNPPSVKIYESLGIDEEHGDTVAIVPVKKSVADAELFAIRIVTALNKTETETTG